MWDADDDKLLSESEWIFGYDHYFGDYVLKDYKGVDLDVAYRMDMLVMDKVVVELKVVENILAIHKSQLLSYLKLSDKKLGLLINFNTPLLKNGVQRVVNNL
jgi:GxxExxY protein